MKKHTVSRFLSLLLCLALCLSMVPAALAAEEDPAEEAPAEESYVGDDALGVPEEPAEETPVDNDTPDVPEEPAEEPVGDPTPGISEEPVEEPSGPPPLEASDIPKEPEQISSLEPISTSEDPEEKLVRVVFVCDPEDLILSIYTLDENGESIIINPEEDGTYLLLPGEYLYDAVCEGYLPIKSEPFIISPSKEQITLSLSLVLNKEIENNRFVTTLATEGDSFSLQLNVPLLAQESHNTCADASARMCISYYYNCGVTTGYSSQPPTESKLLEQYGLGSVTPIQSGLKDYCGVSFSNRTVSSFNDFYEQVYSCLSKGNPVVLCISLTSTNSWLLGYTTDGHYIVVTGLKKEGNSIKLTVNDPYSYSSFTGQGFKGQTVTQNMDEFWYALKYIVYEKDGRVTVSNAYLSQCEYIPAHVKFSVTTSDGAPVWSLPCSSSTDSNSKKLGTLTSGSQAEAVAMYKNTEGNYWYKISYNGEDGYVWCSHTEKKQIIFGTATATGGNNTFSTLEKGKSFGVSWLISAQYSELYKIYGVIRYSGSNNDSIIYNPSVDLADRTTSYQLGNETIDNGMLFNQLAEGTYRTYIVAYVRNYYWDASTSSVKSEWAMPLLKDFTFAVVSAGTTTYYLDLNGYLDGQNEGNITGYGTADVYINGSLVAEGVTDYCTKWPVGTPYEIENIQGVWGHKYDGVKTGSLKGTIANGGDTEVRLTFSTIQGSSSPAATISYNGHTYERYDYNNLSWTEAKAFCESKGGYLVTITDAQEQAKIVSLMDGCPLGLYYIGLTDAASEGKWKWVTNEAFAYSNWDPDAPEPSNGDGENYVQIVGIYNPPNKHVGDWNDVANKFTERTYYNVTNCGFICEYGDYTASCPGDNIGDDFYAYFNHWDAWKHLENENNNVQIGNGNYSIPKQIWHFLRQPDNSYKIVNEYNGGLLAAENGSTADGINVLVSTSDTGANTQRWYFILAGGKSVAYCLANNKAMDLKDGSYANGNNILLNTANGTLAQYMFVYDLLKQESLQYVKPGKPSTPKLSYSISGKNVSFTWTASPTVNEWDSRAYELEIINSSGTSRFVTGLTGTSYSETMTDGVYTVKLRAVNSYYDRNSAAAVVSDPSSVQIVVGTVTYTVSYNANGGTGAPAAQTKTHDVALTLSTTKPTRANASAGSYTVTLNANGGSVSTTSLSAARTTSYTFNNWNTAANGSGTSYASGASYTANAAATLYAQWNSTTTTAAVTLPTPTRSGYTFQGWATSSSAASGSTGSYTPTGNVTLYATWEANKYTVSYDANGGTGAPAAQTKTHDTALTLSTTKPTRANASAGSYTVTLNANGGSVSTTSLSAARTTSYTFNNWNTAANGSGTSYASGASYTANAAATLYAQWNSSTTTAAVTLPTPTRDGYTFQGWATSTDASSGSTGSYTPSADVTLYAIWQQDEPDTFTVTYDAVGGTGAPEPQIKTRGVDLKLSTVKPTHSRENLGYYIITLDANGGNCETTSLSAEKYKTFGFSSWNTKPDYSGTRYTSGATYSDDASVTLYAYWNTIVQSNWVTLPTPTRDGYKFKGWATSPTADSGVVGEYYPERNLTLYAIWETGEYTITYDANGGTGAPEAQTKIKDVALTLSTTKPTRANASAGSYTVTLNANGGSVSTTSLSAARTTSYTFNNWNTAANGSGTSYASGASYTANAAATLYAQWNSSTTTAAVTLPTPTRDGYTFQGWATSTDASSGSTGSYTPTGNVTLYAIWQQSIVTQGTLSVSDVRTGPGKDVTVEVSLDKNPGIAFLGFKIDYDKTRLSLTGSEDAGLTGWTVNVGAGEKAVWVAPDNSTVTGTILKLKFHVLDTAAEGDAQITLSSIEATNVDEDDVYFDFQAGTITIQNRLPGDVNDDGEVNGKDLTRLCRYYAGYDVTINESNADVNGDGVVNGKDLTRLCRYYAGYGVLLD